jgi:hypothetical protein
MSKLKAVLFIPIVGFLHLCCAFALIADRISRASCNMPPYTSCVTPTSEVIEAILSFPFFAIRHVLGLDKQFHAPSLLSFSLLVLNSLMAATLLWLITWVCLCVWRSGRNAT